MEQDCTGSRESRDILKVKRDVDNAVCSHSPQLSVISLSMFWVATKTFLKSTYALNVADYPSPPIKRQQHHSWQQHRVSGNVSHLY